ncbi:MAG: DnaJ domain-containing protein [Bdellovibrionota bacterium]
MQQTPQEELLQKWQEDLSMVFIWGDVGQFASVEFLPKDVTKIKLPLPLKHYVFQALISKYKRIKNKFPPTMRFEINQDAKNISVDELQPSEFEKKIFSTLSQSEQIRKISPKIESTDAEVTPIVLAFREIGLVRADSDPKRKPQAIATPQAAANVPGGDDFTKADEMNVLNKLKDIDTIDYFDLLGVKNDINNAELQKVYFSLAKKYHPDRIKMKMSIAVKDAERFFAKVTEAYNTLSNPVLRKEYEFTHSKEAVAHEELMHRIMKSESVYLEGQAFLNKNQFNEAVDKLKEAIAIYDKEPEYFITLGWALFRQGARDRLSSKIAEGKKLLVDAYVREYQLALVSYYLGMVSKHENKIDDAIKFFRKCISVEPTHSLAASELRFLERKQDEKGGKKK